MSASREKLPKRWLDTWQRSGVPTWGIGPDMTIRFLNRRAEELLGATSSQAVGKPCYEVTKGLDESMEPFCRKSCPVFAAAQNGEELNPETLLLGDAETARWRQVLPIVVAAPDGSGPILVEGATDVDRWARVEGYIRKVAARDPARKQKQQKLTRREAEILDLLSEGLGLREVASRLHVHYTTVRTHVQHILAKLGVHSIDGAVAHNLLENQAEE